jgi:hypothetical protein
VTDFASEAQLTQMIAPADMVEGLAENFGTVFYTWSARHLWGYFSDMTRDEVVVFLNFDSVDDALPGPAHLHSMIQLAPPTSHRVFPAKFIFMHIGNNVPC